MKFWFCASLLFTFSPSFSQMQACPININYATGDLTHWYAYTGNNGDGNGPDAIKQSFDSTQPSPRGTIGVSTINEYNLPTVPGIQVITNPYRDAFGNFSTIPVINGYSYNYSILLGSTSVTHGASTGNGGGYIRGVSYVIAVPATPATQPYTMTYAYAMVLENGTHTSSKQPLFSATLKTKDGIIECASPSYFLPTFDNPIGGGETGATLDSAAAKANGFSVSSETSPNEAPGSGSNGTGPSHLQDVWTKGWTEVTFDLSPYRGQRVTLTFEADNCVPGGHFAYAYVAIRNSCAGLLISGDSLACVGSHKTYSIPSLQGAAYQWSVPADWKIVSGSNSNIVQVNVGTLAGSVVAHEINSCANLQDTKFVKPSPPTVPGLVSADQRICAGVTGSPLLLSGELGKVVRWISSQDGLSWQDLDDTTLIYTPKFLSATTTFKALVQNTLACPIDTSQGATISVDAKSVGGTVSPSNINICEGQNEATLLTVLGQKGSVVTWQSSPDSNQWTSLLPTDTTSAYNLEGIQQSSQYRAIVQDGVCPADTSSIADVFFIKVPFPQALLSPADTTICYGDSILLNSVVNIGTSYSWSNQNSLSSLGTGIIGSLPFLLNPSARPLSTTDYVLSILNAGCPNALTDTALVRVLPQVVVSAGEDTSVVINQPLQLHATSSDGPLDGFLWSPAMGLNNVAIASPVAVLGAEIDMVTYQVTATTARGCKGMADVKVRVFKTPPDIFVPNAFTPGKTMNSVFRPIPVGVSSIDFFRIYNRWGQLVYSTSQLGRGWDGSFGGRPQDNGSYVWMVKGTTYTGKTISKKGVMVLIR